MKIQRHKTALELNAAFCSDPTFDTMKRLLSEHIQDFSRHLVLVINNDKKSDNERQDQVVKIIKEYDAEWRSFADCAKNTPVKNAHGVTVRVSEEAFSNYCTRVYNFTDAQKKAILPESAAN